MISPSTILKHVLYVMLFSIFVFLYFYNYNNIEFFLIFDLIFLFLNIFFLRGVAKNLIYIIFNLMIFLFLLSRPLIEYLYKIDYWDVGLEFYVTSLFIIGLSLFSINIGYSANNRLILKNKIYKLSKRSENILFFIVLCLWIINFIVGLDRYLLLKNLSYTDNYLAFQGRLPSFLVSISAFYIYFFIFFIAAVSNTKRRILVIIFHLLSLVPALLIGERNGVGQFFIFLILYYVLLNKNIGLGNNISLKRIFYIILFSISLIALFNYVGSLREKNSDVDIISSQPYEKNAIVKFLYLQGTSFYTIVQGLEIEQLLPNREDKVYSFGMAIDSLLHNSISSKIFSFPELGSGNNMLAVLNSNNLAHPLSYLVMGDSYLMGHGRGTSYVLENYLDFGFLGVVVLSAILGRVISCLNNSLFFKSYYIRIFALLTMLNLILLPRFTYSGFFYYFFDIKFIISITIMFFIDKLFSEYKVTNYE